MTMSRRDTIVIAVLVNAALLCMLFLMATHEDPVQVPKAEAFTSLSMVEEAPVRREIAPIRAPQSSMPVDDVDQVLAPYIAVAQDVELAMPETVAKAVPEGERHMVEVTVKRGDALEKLARANGTSVAELRRVNGLVNDKLSIGQVLKVPVVSPPLQEPIAQVEGDQETYTLQVGDSPWLIARKFSVRLEDLLQLNQLDETKARNLRPGDKIRIR